MRQVLRIVHSTAIVGLAVFALAAMPQPRDSARAGVTESDASVETMTRVRADDGCMLLGGTWYCW